MKYPMGHKHIQNAHNPSNEILHSGGRHQARSRSSLSRSKETLFKQVYRLRYVERFITVVPERETGLLGAVQCRFLVRVYMPSEDIRKDCVIPGFWVSPI